MKKKSFIASSLSVILISGVLSVGLASCATQRECNFEASMAFFERYVFSVRDVSLSFDMVCDKELSQQFSDMLSTNLCAVNGHHPEKWRRKAYVDVRAVERSIEKGFRTKKTLSVTVEVFNEEGKLLTKRGKYTISKKTLVSSIEQYRLCRQIGRVLRSIR